MSEAVLDDFLCAIAESGSFDSAKGMQSALPVLLLWAGMWLGCVGMYMLDVGVFIRAFAKVIAEKSTELKEMSRGGGVQPAPDPTTTPTSTSLHPRQQRIRDYVATLFPEVYSPSTSTASGMGGLVVKSHPLYKIYMDESSDAFTRW